MTVRKYMKSSSFLFCKKKRKSIIKFMDSVKKRGSEQKDMLSYIIIYTQVLPISPQRV